MTSDQSEGRLVPPDAPGAVYNPTPGATPLPSITQTDPPRIRVPESARAQEASLSPRSSAPDVPAAPAAAARAAPPHPSDPRPRSAAKTVKTSIRGTPPAPAGAPAGAPANVASSDVPENAVLLQSFGTGKPPRLMVYDCDGVKCHRHHLRPAKRQEKLRTMLKDLFKRHPHDETGSSQSHMPHLGFSGAHEPESSSSRGSSRNSSRASSPDASLPKGPIKKTNSEELDRDAADAVKFANAGTKPPSLLNSLAHRLRSSDADPDALVSEALTKQNTTTDPKLADRYGQCSSVIGKGSFGVVRLAQRADPMNKHRQFTYAVKEFHPSSSESQSKYLKRLVSEFYLASSLHHPNIIQTIDLLKDGNDKYCGVMEYCAGGDLYSLIVVTGKLESAEADCFFKQIMRAVAYMHEMGIAHRDLKPENVLLTSRGCCKLTDFGNTECFRGAGERTVHMSSAVAGSGPYIAPEEYKKQEFDPRAVDVWAVGMIYMAMMTGRHLWHEAKSSDEFYVKYLTGRKDEHGYEPIERLKMPKRRNVIYSVLDPVASRRLTAKQVLNSEWGREINVCPAGLGEP